MQFECTEASSVKIGATECTLKDLKLKKKARLTDLIPTVCTDPKKAKKMTRMNKDPLAEEIFALGVHIILTLYASGEITVSNEPENARAETQAKLLRIGYDCTDVAFGDPPSSTLQVAAKDILAAENGSKEKLHEGTLNAHEMILLVDILCDGNLSATVAAIARGQSREAVDARDSPWEAVAVAFNDFICNEGETDPTKTYRKCSDKALKKAWTRMSTAFTTVFKNYMASGQQGGPDLDDNIDFSDHVAWVFSNEEHFTDFSNFSKHAALSQTVMNHMFKALQQFPSLSPMTVRLAEGGVEGDKILTGDDFPAPRKVSKKRKTSDSRAALEKSYRQQCDAEKMLAYAGEFQKNLEILGESIPERMKTQFRDRLAFLHDALREATGAVPPSSQAGSSSSQS